jgi:hypothetical protein
VKFAYADPPYYGCGRLYAHLHDQARVWDDKESHFDLVSRLLEEYQDGWALSCNPRDLSWLLPACPDTARVCAWVKNYHAMRPNVSVQYAWECVIVVGGRKIKGRKPMIRDWITGPATRQTGTPGAKPDYFNRWVLELLGYQDGDTLDDLFPGSGGMGWTVAQGVMFP